MEEVTAEMLKLNIALLVNHNEVAPSQHELSPIFALTNVSSDQNMVCMQVHIVAAAVCRSGAVRYFVVEGAGV